MREPSAVDAGSIVGISLNKEQSSSSKLLPETIQKKSISQINLGFKKRHKLLAALMCKLTVKLTVRAISNT